MFHKNKKGFTLVELLIIIAIIGILSTVAVVNLRSAKEKAFKHSILATVHATSRAVLPCIYDDRPLLCDGGPCDGERSITEGNLICAGGERWTDFDHPEIGWYRANYNLDTLDYCIEAYWDDPMISGSWTDPYEFFTCTNDGCFYDYGSNCSAGCVGLNGNCSSNPCCGGLSCVSNICQQLIPVSI